MKRLLLLPVLMFGLIFSQEVVADDLGIIMSRSLSMTNFCGNKTAVCSVNSLNRDKYLGMTGRLTSKDPVSEEFGMNIFEIKMSDGSLLYYSTREESPFADRHGPDKLSNHNKKLSRIGRSVIEGGKVTVDDVFLAKSGVGYKYKLSTGNEIFDDTFLILEKILPKIPADKETEFVEMINDISLKYDDMEDVYFISISSISLGSSESLPIQLYLVIQDNKALARVNYYYRGDNWLFIDRVLIKIDDQRININRLAFNRDNSSYSVWEWHDKVASREDMDMLNDIVLGEDVNVRFYGRQSYSDKEISSKQRELMSNIMKIYGMF